MERNLLSYKMDVKECFEKGLLKKEKEDRNKSLKSIEMAEYKLEKAKSLFNKKIYDMSLVNAYLSMFHAARGLLFKDGVKEKSHYGLYVYLKEKYKDRIEQRFLNELNALRLERHEVFYGLEKIEIKEVEAEDVLKDTELFLEAVRRLV